MDMSKYKVETIPTPPSIPKPRREEFCNNADWGAALDQWEVEVEERKQQAQEIQKKNSQCRARAYEQFRKDLIEDLGWEWMSEQQLIAVMEYVTLRGHHAGFSELYAIAEELCEMFDTFRPK